MPVSLRDQDFLNMAKDVCVEDGRRRKTGVLSRWDSSSEFLGAGQGRGPIERSKGEARLRFFIRIRVPLR